MVKIYLTAILMLLISVRSFSQFSITGKVKGKDQQKVQQATLMLLQAIDSSLVKVEISNDDGSYNFFNIAEGKYMIKISNIGFETVTTSPFILKNQNIILEDIVLNEYLHQLDEIVISAPVSLIEQKPDKLILNVENSILSTNGNVLDILEKAPGIRTDKDGLISLKGKQGVLIMINDKLSYLSDADVTEMLRNMPADNISAIEILNNPSAKYDAAGNAGVINIKLKKNKGYGLNGTLNLGGGYGKYAKHNGGLNLNYRNKALNIYGSYSYTANKRYIINNLDRKLDVEDKMIILNQQNYRTIESLSHSFRMGVDFNISKSSVLGLLVNGLGYHSDIVSDNTTAFDNPNEQQDSLLKLFNNKEVQRQSITYNLNYNTTIKSSGASISADVDFSTFKGRGYDDIKNRYYSTVQTYQMREPLEIRSKVPVNVEITSLKADYSHPVSEGSKIEVGLKSSMVSTKNEVLFEQRKQNQWTVYNDFESDFQYNEDIHAAYFNFNSSKDKYELQVGLRAELTNAAGSSRENPKIIDRSYLEWFPNFSYTRSLNKNHSATFAYSRSIDRPDYQKLNPFIYFVDLYTYLEGNQELKPDFTHAYSLTHTFRDQFITSFGYQYTRDLMAQVTEQDDMTKITKARTVNFDNFYYYYLNVSIPTEVTPWWSSIFNINAYHRQYKSNYLGHKLDRSGYSCDVYTSQQFSLSKSLSAEIIGSYFAPVVEGIAYYESMYTLNMGLEKKIFKNVGTLKLSVNDVFNSLEQRSNIKYKNMDIDALGKWETRIYRLTFSYKFGRSEIKAARRRTVGSEDEQQRIKAGGD